MKRWIITTSGQPNLPHIGNAEEDEILKLIRHDFEMEEKAWDHDHAINQYRNVFSITDDVEVCMRLTKGIDENVEKVLIPGCGSKTNLQRHIVENFTNIRSIDCTDWSQSAIDQASAGYSHEKIRYWKEDSSALPFQHASFDYVIISNSILSNQDVLNRKMIQECHRVLKRGKPLYGMFPTIYCAAEFTYLDTRFAHWLTDGTIDLTKNSFYEREQKLNQIFYTPLRLKQILQEAGFTRRSFEICFFDNAYFERENEKIYGIPPDSGLSIWEILVSMEK